jgi:hypothetical protein
MTLVINNLVLFVVFFLLVFRSLGVYYNINNINDFFFNIYNFFLLLFHSLGDWGPETFRKWIPQKIDKNSAEAGNKTFCYLSVCLSVIPQGFCRGW